MIYFKHWLYARSLSKGLLVAYCENDYVYL